MQQNASQYVPRQSMKREVAADIRNIFNSPDRAQAEAQLCKTVEKYAQSASRLADWLEGNIPEGLTVFSFPDDHRRRIRTVNSLERVCLEIRRRTRVACIFPNEASCLRLVSALLMEISETWETGKIYFYRIPRSLLRGFRALTKSVPVGAKFRNTPSACSGDRNFEDFDSLFYHLKGSELHQRWVT
ncbi:MAG: transposase [Anaerolineales bacterium]|nr:transposase [Anaerolineales bacterium]